MYENRERNGHWPDGRSLLEQPNIVTEVLYMMQLCIERELKNIRRNKEDSGGE